jgi:hypothetical protein
MIAFRFGGGTVASNVTEPPLASMSVGFVITEKSFW